MARNRGMEDKPTEQRRRAMKIVDGFFLGFVLCVGLVGAPARANDSTFGGAGSDLVPLEEARVRMVSEDILIEYRGRWHVTARYVFENLTEKAVRVQVGFPEYRCEDEYQDCRNLPFEDLRTEIDGIEAVHRLGTLSKKHAWKPHLGVVWLYDVTFPVGKEVKVLHTYSVASGEDVDQSRFTTYVTRTGALWAGAIGHARFTFRLPATAHTVVVPEGIALQGLRLVDPDGPAPYVEVVCEQANWNPAGDLWILFNDSARLAMDRLGSEALARSGLRAEDLCPAPGEREEATSAQRQMCVNDGYAVAGYPFKKESLQKYYYGDPFPWRREPIPWDRKESWYVRGLRPFPQLPAWQNRETQPEGATPPPGGSAPKLTDAGPDAETANASVPEHLGVVSQGPPPVQPRAGGCGCQLPASKTGFYWPLASLPLLVWIRRAGSAARSGVPYR